MRKTHAEINAALDAKMAALGINHQAGEYSNALLGVALGLIPAIAGESLPTVTVYPSAVVIERLAHYGADRLIANNAAYASMCERLDAELAEILEGVINADVKNPTHAKSTCAKRVLMYD
jgi:hypothetical protein